MNDKLVYSYKQIQELINLIDALNLKGISNFQTAIKMLHVLNNPFNEDEKPEENK